MRAWPYLLGSLVLASCKLGTLPPAAGPDTLGYPRCVAVDADGTEIACPAPPRTYDGDSCTCANMRGLAYPGRVRDYPRP